MKLAVFESDIDDKKFVARMIHKWCLAQNQGVTETYYQGKGVFNTFPTRYIDGNIPYHIDVSASWLRTRWHVILRVELQDDGRLNDFYKTETAKRLELKRPEDNDYIYPEDDEAAVAEFKRLFKRGLYLTSIGTDHPTK